MNPTQNLNIFARSVDHLKTSRVGYFWHLYGGVVLGCRMIYLGITSILHGIVPAFFEGDAPLGVAKLFYRHVQNHPNPAFQVAIAAERERSRPKNTSE